MAPGQRPRGGSEPPLLAGAASLDVRPPLGLPMLGFVRRQSGATGYGLPLEVTALVIEGDDRRVALIGVDTLGIQSPEVDELRATVAAEIEADPAGVLLSWNHTHCAPPPSEAFLRRSGLLEIQSDERIGAYGSFLASRIIEVARTAAARLEPAAVTWGVGEVDLAVNRRERDAEGRIVHGWRQEGLLDRQVVVVQAQRLDGSPIATVVGFGCHPVAVGMDVPLYSGDYPAALRLALRRFVGGECVFLQGAGGNVLPMVAFGGDESSAVSMGERLAIEAVHAVADRPAWPRRLVRSSDGSLIPMFLARFEQLEPQTTIVDAVEERVLFPLQSAPTVEELEATRDDCERRVAEAVARDAGPAERLGLVYHAKWARELAAARARGEIEEGLAGSIHALRIGEGVIVTAPGEVFTEIGIAVKERSPGRPTLYAGYVNGAVGYFPTTEAYAEGGYEPAYSNRSYGALAPVSPACERLLVERGVRLAESLFPEREPYDGRSGWKAAGEPPLLPPPSIPRPETAPESAVAVAPAPG